MMGATTTFLTIAMPKKSTACDANNSRTTSHKSDFKRSGDSAGAESLRFGISPFMNSSQNQTDELGMIDQENVETEKEIAPEELENNAFEEIARIARAAEAAIDIFMKDTMLTETETNSVDSTTSFDSICNDDESEEDDENELMAIAMIRAELQTCNIASILNETKIVTEKPIPQLMKKIGKKNRKKKRKSLKINKKGKPGFVYTVYNKNMTPEPENKNKSLDLDKDKREWEIYLQKYLFSEDNGRNKSEDQGPCLYSIVDSDSASYLYLYSSIVELFRERQLLW